MVEKLHAETLLSTLVLFTNRYHRPISLESVTAGLPVEPNTTTPDLLHFSQASTTFSRAAKRIGFTSTLIERPLRGISELHLPLIILLADANVCILEAFDADKQKAKVVYAEGDGVEEWVALEKLEEVYLGYAFLLKKELDSADDTVKERAISQKHWFWDTIKLSTPIYRDVLVASLLVNLFVLASPLFTMNVYDRVIPNNAMETLAVFSIGVLMVYLLDSFLKFIRTRLLEIAAKKSDVVMSSIIFEKVLDLKMAVHPKSIGSFANNIKDFEAVRSFLTNATMAALIDLPFAVIFLLVIFYIGGNIVLIPMTIMVIILLYALFIKEPLRESIESTHEASARKHGILIETLQNIETIKTQTMNGHVQWHWEESVGEIAQKSFKSRMLSASVPTITGLLVQINTVGIVVYGVMLIDKLELTMGGLIGIVILASRTVAPMGQVAALITNYNDARSSYNTINEIISQPLERPEGHRFLQRDSFNAKIEFKNVNFSYPDSEQLALNDVSFVINPGEHVGIIGRIGSGKSTIEKLILKLYDPDEGSILIDDIDIAQIDPAQLREQIGYVSQDVALFKGTVKDNILHRNPNVSDEKLLEAATLSGVDEFVRRHPMGYGMPIGERSQGLSGGQRQSIGIARALISDAPLMLLDEPTNALDQLSESRLLNHLKTAFAGKKTVILVTQKLGLLAITPRVIVMNEGKVYLDGPREQVLKALQGENNEA